MRSRHHLAISFSFVTLGALASMGDASAQGISESEREGRALYLEGTALMDTKEYDKACPKIANVVRLLPKEVGAKIELARCYRDWERFATAYEAYRIAAQAAEAAKKPESQLKAEKEGAAILPKVSTLTIVVPTATGSLPEVRVKRGDTVVKRKDWGKPAQVDGGTYPITVTARGMRPWERVIQVGASAANESIEVGPLEPEEAPTQSVPPPVAPSPSPDRSSFWSAPRVVGLALGVAGVAGVGTSLYLGAQARAKRDESQRGDHCVNGNECDSIGTLLLEEAYSNGNVATWLFVPGAALLGGGVLLLALGPRGGDTSTPSSGPAVNLLLGPRGVAVQGSW